MIVRSSDGVLQLITQPAHAALARRIMEEWPALQSASRRASISLAIGDHDNGWHEPDAEPSIEPASGRPFDFIMAPVEVRQGVWPRAVARLEPRDPWAAALVAQHAVSVYERFRSDPAWTPFFDGMEATRDRLVRASGHNMAEMAGDYVFLRTGDLISLIFCNRWTPQLTFEDHVFQLRGDRVVVTPDPFNGREVGIAIEAREIPDVRYRSDRDLRDALRAAPRRTLRGVVTGVAY